MFDTVENTFRRIYSALEKHIKYNADQAVDSNNLFTKWYYGTIFAALFVTKLITWGVAGVAVSSVFVLLVVGVGSLLGPIGVIIAVLASIIIATGLALAILTYTD